MSQNTMNTLSAIYPQINFYKIIKWLQYQIVKK